MENKIIIASGYFDPIHKGHIEYLKLAKQLGNKLIVILNNDEQAKLKKGKPFMSVEEKKIILKAIKYVDEVFISVDQDKSVAQSLKAIAKKYPNDKLIFANGGNRHQREVPERTICRKYNIEMRDGLGEKIQSSSNLTRLNREHFRKIVLGAN